MSCAAAQEAVDGIDGPKAQLWCPSGAGKTRPATKKSGGESSALAQQEEAVFRVASGTSRRKGSSPNHKRQCVLLVRMCAWVGGRVAGR